MFSFVQEMANETANMSASELQQFLAYHLVPQALTASNLQDDRTLTTMDNNSKLLIKEYHSVHIMLLSIPSNLKPLLPYRMQTSVRFKFCIV